MSETYVACSCCEYFILVKSDKYLNDTYYKIGDDIVCDDCILDYIKKCKNKEL